LHSVGLAPEARGRLAVGQQHLADGKRCRNLRHEAAQGSGGHRPELDLDRSAVLLDPNEARALRRSAEQRV
jgi:hypothetical protein